jgi:hypothetical protein
MNTDRSASAGGLVMFRLMESLVTDVAVIAAGELGVFDALASGPRDSDDLAEVTGSHPPSLHRLLRLLAAAGLVTETEPGRFSLTETAAALQRTTGSLQPLFQLFSRVMLPCLLETASSVRTGEPAFERLVGAPIYEYLGKHPEHEEAFGQMMKLMRDIAGSITEVYDFAGAGTVVDVGGGVGWRTIEILEAHPTMRGILFDRPGTTEHARMVLAEAGLSERTEVVAGSFFDQVPGDGDCYLVSAVLPNWDDPDALAILEKCKDAMPPHGRLLVFEPVLPEGDEPHIGKVFDLMMLVVLGGRVRTEDELRRLLDTAGFRVNRVLPTSGAFAVVEAVPAG